MTPKEFYYKRIEEEPNVEPHQLITEYLEYISKDSDKTTSENNLVTKQLFIQCDCSSEGILLTHYDDEPNIYLAIYSEGQFIKKPSLWRKLKYCINYLRTSKIYEDQIILSFEKAKELKNWIDSITN